MKQRAELALEREIEREKKDAGEKKAQQINQYMLQRNPFSRLRESISIKVSQ